MRSMKAEPPKRAPRTKTPTRAKRGGSTRPANPPSGGAKRPRVVEIQSPVVRPRWRIFRRPMLTLTAVFMLLMFIAALFVGGYVHRAEAAIGDTTDAMIAGAGFGISEIHLSGNARTPPNQLLDALHLKPGQSIFGADLQAARFRLMELSWVADADVQRRYPDAINVHIIEKLPFALWKSPQGIYVVERSGRLITNQDVQPFAKLPLLAGEGAPEAAADIVEAVALHRAVSARLRVYQRQSQRRWNLILDDGVVVKLPEIGWQGELDALEKLIVDRGILERNVQEIDMRERTHLFFILKGGQSKDVGSEL